MLAAARGRQPTREARYDTHTAHTRVVIVMAAAAAAAAAVSVCDHDTAHCSQVDVYADDLLYIMYTCTCVCGARLHIQRGPSRMRLRHIAPSKLINLSADLKLCNVSQHAHPTSQRTHARQTASEWRASRRERASLVREGGRALEYITCARVNTYHAQPRRA